MSRRPHAFTFMVVALFALGATLALKSDVIYANTLNYQRYVAMSQLLSSSDQTTAELLRAIQKTQSGDTRAVSRRVVANLRRRLAAAEVEAGWTAVAGKGIQVWLSDSPLASGSGEEDYLIHDIDLITIVNVLNAAGAKAVSINGQRVVATTDIHCAGPVISINGVRTAPPITIQAVGNPARLKAEVDQAGGIVTELEAYAIPVKVTVEASVHVPPFVPNPKEVY